MASNFPRTSYCCPVQRVNMGAVMSESRHKRTISTCSRDVRFTPKSGHRRAPLPVRFVPKADSCTAAILDLLEQVTDVFLPAGSAGCKAPARSHHIPVLAL